MHGSLAPSAAAADWTGQKLNIHSQSQGIYPLRASIADSLDLEENQVEITHVPGSGCYGHSGADDAAFEAALIDSMKSTQAALMTTSLPSCSAKTPAIRLPTFFVDFP